MGWWWLLWIGLTLGPCIVVQCCARPNKHKRCLRRIARLEYELNMGYPWSLKYDPGTYAAGPSYEMPELERRYREAMR
jgi:hypothetical protein